MCHPNISLSQLHQADEALVSFCSHFEQLYGKDKCTPNKHLHCHLKECILDVGPLYSFCFFSFERYNGILGGMKKTWHAPEIQLIHKNCSMQSTLYLEAPMDTSTMISSTLEMLKISKLTLAQAVSDPLAIIQYQKNSLGELANLCALSLHNIM